MTTFQALVRWDMQNQDVEMVAQLVALAELSLVQHGTPQTFTLERVSPIHIFCSMEIINISSHNDDTVMFALAQAPNVPVAILRPVASTKFTSPSPFDSEQLIELTCLQHNLLSRGIHGCAAELIRIAHEAIPSSRACHRIAKLHFSVVVPNLIELIHPHDMMRVRATFHSPTNDTLTVLTFDGTVLAVCHRELAITSTPLTRYNKGLIMGLSPACRAMGVQSRHHWGEISVTTLHITREEMANDGSFLTALLHYADSSTSVVWEVLIAQEDDAFSTTLESDGHRKFVVFWRAAIAHVFARPRPGQRLFAHNYLSKVGRSSFEFTAELFVKQGKKDGDIPIAHVHFTMACVERLTNKPVPVFFDSAFAEKRYPMIKQESPFAKRDVYNTQWCKRIREKTSTNATFIYRPSILHRVQDLNGHVNSGRYCFLIEEARDACLADTTFLSTEARTLLQRTNGWCTSFGLDYGGEIKREDHVEIRISYELENQVGLFVFEFVVGDKVLTVIWVESKASMVWNNTVDNENVDNVGVVTGCDGEHWGVGVGGMKL